MVKVLVVEDEASIREMIALNLRLAGMEAVEADSIFVCSGAAALRTPCLDRVNFSCLCWSRSPAVMLPFWM